MRKNGEASGPFLIPRAAARGPERPAAAQCLTLLECLPKVDFQTTSHPSHGTGVWWCQPGLCCRLPGDCDVQHGPGICPDPGVVGQWLWACRLSFRCFCGHASCSVPQFPFCDGGCCGLTSQGGTTQQLPMHIWWEPLSPFPKGCGSHFLWARFRARRVLWGFLTALPSGSPALCWAAPVQAARGPSDWNGSWGQEQVLQQLMLPQLLVPLDTSLAQP